MEESTPKYQTFVVNSAKYKTLYTRKFEMRKKWERPNPNEIRSYIPGTIIKMCVKPGQEVKEGECLLILEAMKMENKIEMPFDGKIKEIHVEEGVRIPRDVIMVTVE
jgi:biotin carboxyl carrier protein